MKESFKYFSIGNINTFLKNNNAAPLKKWGQNFLIDSNIIQIILNQYNLKPEETEVIVEIGPGLGAITNNLDYFKKQIYLFEIDPILIKNLKENNFNKSPYILIEGDFLKTYTILNEKTFFCFGNLPYYISTEILTTLLLECRGLKGGIFMLQKEFVEKIIKETSSIGIFLHSFGEWNHIKNVSPSCFYPSPKTESSLLFFKKFENQILTSGETKVLQKILRGFFWGKRKTIQKNIKDSPFFHDSDREKILSIFKSELNLSGNERAEDLKKEDFYKLSKYLQNLN